MNGDLIVKVIMAAGALGTMTTGYFLAKRGQVDTKEQSVAATQLQARVNTLGELESVITHLKEERDYVAAEAERLRQRHTVESQWQAARCQVQLDRLVENLATLQSIVTDEIARAASLEAVQGAQEHEETDHDRTWEPGETRY